LTIKTIIIEDEQTAQNHLIKLVGQLKMEISVLTTLTTISESIKWLKSHLSPDLIFMDIQLSDGISFDILKEITPSCPIIYTTAYDEYAIQAFKTTGIAYLLKPITLEDLKYALDKFTSLQHLVSDEWLIRNIDLQRTLKQQENRDYKERFLLKMGVSMVPVKSEEIAYFYRDELVFAQLFNGKSFPMDDSLNHLQEIVNPTLFIRLNRQLLANVNAIKKLTPYKPGQLMLEIEPPFAKPIFLSQERSSWLKRFLDKSV